MATFNFTFDPGTTVQQMIGFEIAGRVWSAYLTDNTTINLQVGVSSTLASNVIGGALPGMRAGASYADFYSRLNADAKSTDDRTAIRNLEGTSTYNNSWFCTHSMNLNGPGHGFNYQNTKLNLTRANAKALGMNPDSVFTSTTGALDGYIIFSNLANAKTASGAAVTWNYDYTRRTAPGANSLDFLSTAIHEIGHILGFTSGVDAPGWLDTTMVNTNFAAYESAINQRAQNANPLDFFRYSQETVGLNTVDLATGGATDPFRAKYFSIDGGTTEIAKYSAGANTTLQGDGSQASHWKGGTTGIMAPTLKTGTRSAIAGMDLKALDVIGWDLATSGINTAINLSTLQTNARNALAIRAGQTTTWINNNLNTSPTQLAQNNDLRLYGMLVNSQIYDLTRITNPGSTGTISRQALGQIFEERGLWCTYNCPCGGCNTLNQQGLFPKLDELVLGQTSNPTQPTMTGESGHLSGAAELGMTPALGITKIIRSYSQDASQVTDSVQPLTADRPLLSVVNLSSNIVDSSPQTPRFTGPVSSRTRAYDSTGSRTGRVNPTSGPSQRFSSLDSEFITIDSHLEFALNPIA